MNPTFRVLRNTFSREHLIDHCKKNGLLWNESNDEGINWMRVNRALKNHLEADGDFHTDDVDPRLLKQMHDHYHVMRELHKKTMVPHLKATMSKLSQDDGGSKHPMEYLDKALEHLEANGGHIWRDKLTHLVHLNNKIKGLKARIE